MTVFQPFFSLSPSDASGFFCHSKAAPTSWWIFLWFLMIQLEILILFIYTAEIKNIPKMGVIVTTSKPATSRTFSFIPLKTCPVHKDQKTERRRQLLQPADYVKAALLRRAVTPACIWA